jgi:hypothetical protein
MEASRWRRESSAWRFIFAPAARPHRRLQGFQRPMAEGIKLLHTVQDVYLCKEVTVA